MNANTPAGKVALGFIAGAISVVIFHQGMILILGLLGAAGGSPWSMAPNAWGVPALINNMFWGGIWGIVFAYASPFLPAMPVWTRGLILGVAGNWFIGNQIVVPLIRRAFGQNAALFGFVNNPRFWVGVLIGGAFGLGWALIHATLSARAR